MKTIRNLFVLAAMTMSITACTQDDGWPTGADQVIAATVQTPVEGWGTLSRALPSGYSNLTLHYTAAKNDALTSYPVSESGITSSGNSFNFVTKGTPQLVWAEVKENTPLYLLVNHNADGAFWASESPTAHPQDNLAFELKPRYAKLTVKATITGGAAVAANDIGCSLNHYSTDVDATPVTAQPMKHGTTTETWVPTFSSSNNHVYAASTVFAPQALANDTKELTFTVCGQIFTLDLSTVTVTRTDAFAATDEANGIYAANDDFGYNVGEHIMLDVKLNLQALTPGAITVTDFSAASSGYTQELNGSVSTNP